MKRVSLPVGWRGESYRHYLAGKGVSTSRYMRSKWKRFVMPDIERIPVELKGTESPMDSIPLRQSVEAARKEQLAEYQSSPARVRINVEAGIGELFPTVTPGTTEALYDFIEGEKRKELLFRINRFNEFEARSRVNREKLGVARKRYEDFMREGVVPRDVALAEINKIDTVLREDRESLQREREELFG